MHIEQKSFPRYFSATTGWNSTKLYGNLQYHEKMRISLPCWGHLNSELLVMQYAYRKIFVFALLLCNYWLEFNETLLEPSIPRGDAHIVALF
jgi:hypothetical protein